MRRMVLAALIGAGLVTVVIDALDRPKEVFAQQMAAFPQHGSKDGLIAVPGPTGEQGQLLAVIDPRGRVMSVYHIDKATGKIGLRSVRNIHWDLQMMEFDNEGLLPREIRSLLEQR